MQQQEFKSRQVLALERSWEKPIRELIWGLDGRAKVKEVAILLDVWPSTVYAWREQYPFESTNSEAS